MLRSLVVQALACVSLYAAIWPDQFGAFRKSAPKSVAVPDQALCDEYGLEATEQADYISAEQRFIATAWRMRDSTGALALFEARRPPQAAASPLATLAVTTSDGVIFAYGNYVFQFTGRLPKLEELKELYAGLPRLEQSALPALMSYLPADGLVPNSERYVVGPVSLERFEPRIPPSVAAFHLGTEAQLGKYRVKDGIMALAIFNYPTPSLARDRVGGFEKLPNALVKRTGPLVAVILSPPDADAAERLLAKVSYQANLTWNERVPSNQTKSFAKMILSIFMLAGLLLGFCLVAGLAVGGVRIWLRKLGKLDAHEPMVVLHLSDK